MIISILGDVFDEFQIDAEIFNYSEMINVILEIEQIFSFKNDTDKLDYLHICDHAYEKPKDEWKGKIIDIRDYLKDKFLKNHLKPLFEKNNENIKKNDKKMDSNFMVTNNNVKDVNEKIKNVNDNVTAMHAEALLNFTAVDEKIKNIDEKMSRFQDRVENIEEKINNIHESMAILLRTFQK